MRPIKRKLVSTFRSIVKEPAESNEFALASPTLHAMVDELENRSRRCNLIFYGVNDTHAHEPNAESKKLLSNICKSHLGIDSVTLEQAHRLGEFQVGKNRTLIAKFTRFKEKQRVLINAKKLKGANISLSEDYSESVRRKNKFL